jgi:archaellum biogenesis ATPase FlaH
MARGMAKVIIVTVMETSLRESGRMMIKKLASIFLVLEISLRVHLKMGKWHLEL